MEKNKIDSHYLNKVEYKIYNFFLLRLLEQKTNTYSEGQKALAKVIGCHENSIGNNVKSLMERGWIKRSRNSKSYSLIFILPEEDFQCRISYCTGLNFESLNNMRIRNELESIFEKLARDIDKLEQEVFLLRKKKQEKNPSKITFTREHSINFVDRLLVTLGNNFDQRSLEDKVLAEINSLRKRLSSSNNNINDNYSRSSELEPDPGFKAIDFQKGLEEILAIRRKK